MTTATGRTQYVEQGKVGSISIRLLDDLTAQEIALSATLSASTLTLYGQGGAVIAASANPTSVSGAVATYQRTWTTSSFPRLRGYRAEWTLSDGSTTYDRTTYFEVVRRLFRSQLTDADLTDRIPYLTSRLPSGQSNFSLYRSDAWREIQERLTAVFPEIRNAYRSSLGRNYNNHMWGSIDSDYPGNIFNPEQFFDAHRYLSLAIFHEDICIGGDIIGESSDERAAKRFRQRYEEAFARAKTKIAIDVDDDGLMDDNERSYNYTSIERVR